MTAYTPGGQAGARPNRATIVYSNLVRQAFPGLPVAIGGIEASLRRATHYDFWTDKVRRSILLDSKADLLVYGMGERAILEAARWLEAAAVDAARPGDALWGIRGTVFAVSSLAKVFETPNGPEKAQLLILSCHGAILDGPRELMSATLALEQQVHQGGRWAIQESGGRYVVFAPPAEPLDTDELDALYALPFTRKAHPFYTQPIPAADMIQFSVTSHRGCAGGCTFCSIALHQGRRIRSRSVNSLEREVRTLTRHPDWRQCQRRGRSDANLVGARAGRSTPRAAGRLPDAGYYAPHFEGRAELVRLCASFAHRRGESTCRWPSGIRL